MKKLVENPVLIGLMVVLNLNCYSPPDLSEEERFIRNHPTWKNQADEILNKPVDNNINNLNDIEKISLVIMSIEDIRKERHQYNKPIKIMSHEKDIQRYCKKHFGYEIIKPLWNPKINGYNYIVSSPKHTENKNE